MKPLNLKSPEEIKIMAEGGKILSYVNQRLKEKVREGVTAGDLEVLANDLITSAGAEPSFKKVKGYSWATCVNVNDGIVHGIPSPSLVFKNGDIVSVDCGVYYKGFHTDASFSLEVGSEDRANEFLLAGIKALRAAVGAALVGNYVYDISSAIENTLIGCRVNPVTSLVGHGVGRDLHEDPPIPCVARGDREKSLPLVEGMVLAIEVMYTEGSPELVLEKDGWTISTADGKISGLFEETVAVTQNGPLVLTNLDFFAASP
jgi:methionyl aminopeptidase